MNAWWAERAGWHGTMAVYCVQNALKDNTSQWDATYYGNEAFALAREAAHFGHLALHQTFLIYDDRVRS